MFIVKRNCDERHPGGDAGFTLLELLIAISVIAILMGLSFSLLNGLLNQSREEATTATIRKVSALFENRYQAFNRAFTGNRKDNAVASTRALLANNQIFGVRPEVVDILAKKALFRNEFPQRMNDLIVGTGDANNNTFLDGDDNGDGLADAVAAAFTGITWSNHDPRTESSELLYYFLFHSRSFGAADTNADRFTTQEIADTDGDGLPELIDSWGEPLRFYRWPTRLMDPDAPVVFQPDRDDWDETTDVPVYTDVNDDGILDDNLPADGIPDPVGQRTVSPDARTIAATLIKGLPPESSKLPGGTLPRDPMLTDPDDPVGRLYSELERLNGLNGTPTFANEFNEANYHTPDTYHIPLIVSAGADEELGLFEPTDVTNRGNLAAYDSSTSFQTMRDRISDNITNRNRRAGGRR
jgi:prepilin-type N-terminal cleavage/methylation domain-containing protein